MAQKGAIPDGCCCFVVVVAVANMMSRQGVWCKSAVCLFACFNFRDF